jgi:hypothetical protein
LQEFSNHIRRIGCYARNLLESLEGAEVSEQPPKGTCASAGARVAVGDALGLSVDLRCKTVALDGVRYDVTSEQALRWLKVLAEHSGEWIAGPDLQTYDALLVGARTDKLRPYLPKAVAKLIESSTGKGSRFNPPATGVKRP